MQAVLLAGGLGTRLRSVVSDRPKPMALIEGRPFMEYVVRGLYRCGITDIIFAVGYKGSMVEEYFKDGGEFGVRVSYAYEEELLGTAGAIKNAGKFVTEDRFFVLNADTFYQMDYSRLASLYEELELDMALVLRKVEDVSRYGAAVLKDRMLVGFNEKPGGGTSAEKTREVLKAGNRPDVSAQAGIQNRPDVLAQADTGNQPCAQSRPASRPGTINGGVYLMRRSLLDEIPEGKVSLENEMIPRWMQEKKRLGGLVSDGYFIDIGVPEDYFRFQEDVRKGVVSW